MIHILPQQLQQKSCQLHNYLSVSAKAETLRANASSVLGVAPPSHVVLFFLPRGIWKSAKQVSTNGMAGTFWSRLRWFFSQHTHTFDKKVISEGFGNGGATMTITNVLTPNYQSLPYAHTDFTTFVNSAAMQIPRFSESSSSFHHASYPTGG